MATLNVELSDSAFQALHAMAAEQHVPISHLIESLVEQPLFELSESQMQEVDLAIAAVDRGGIASDETIRQFFARYADE